jgi:hypothetical protein
LGRKLLFLALKVTGRNLNSKGVREQLPHFVDNLIGLLLGHLWLGEKRKREVGEKIRGCEHYLFASP